VLGRVAAVADAHEQHPVARIAGAGVRVEHQLVGVVVFQGGSYWVSGWSGGG
jgi:hypothetical protein